MKILQCGKCGHIEFNSAPAACLVCHSPGSQFKDDPGAIKKPGQPGAGEADQKHIPAVSVEPESLFAGGESVTVKVKVGSMEHPMKAEHFIRYLDLYLNHAFINRVWFSPVVNRPAAAFSIAAKSGTITVIENCNVHGTWMTEKAF